MSPGREAAPSREDTAEVSDEAVAPLVQANRGVSYGEEKPVADDKTREERAQNRRVVIRILE